MFAHSLLIHLYMYIHIHIYLYMIYFYQCLLKVAKYE